MTLCCIINKNKKVNKLRSIVVLGVGIFVSFLYVMLIVYFQADSSKEAGFLYRKNGNSLSIGMKLPQRYKKNPLVDKLQKICADKECNNSIVFDKNIKPLKWIDLIDKLVLFAEDKNISKATVLTTKDGKLEINFLLKNRDDLIELDKICKGYKDIRNASSVIEVFSISKIENDINTVLKNSALKFDLSQPDTDTQKVLKRVFRKLKELGKTDILFWVNISENDTEILKRYIKQNFNWIENIEFKKDKVDKIKIKEVLS